MPYLKKLVKNNNGYYYLYHTVREGNKFRKLSKYIGKKKPSQKELDRLKKDFIEEMNATNQKKGESRINLIATLQDIQDRKGFLPVSELAKLSRERGIPGTDIFGIATFYSQFKLEKPAKYIIYVCTGTACHVKGSTSILQYLKQHLDIDVGETTKNGLISIERVNCIGACAKAPAMMINDKVYGNVDNHKLRKILESLK